MQALKSTFSGFYDVNNRKIHAGDSVEIDDYSKFLGWGRGVVEFRRDSNGFEQWVIIQRHSLNPNGLSLRALPDALPFLKVV